MLIVNADDFGQSKEINEGILLTHRRGCVTSTSAFVNQPLSRELYSLAEKAPRLGVGLHVNFTLGRPLTPFTQVRSVVDGAGDFYSALELIEQAPFVRAEDVATEVAAQLAEFRRMYGRMPDHMDVHQYSLCFLPNGLHGFLQVASEAGIPVRNCQTFVEPDRLDGLLRRITELHGVDLSHVERSERAAALGEVWQKFFDVRSPALWEHRFHGDFELPDLLETLSQLPEGVSELMCHPTTRSKGDSPFEQSRPRECYLLTHPDLMEFLRGKSLATFAQAFA